MPREATSAQSRPDQSFKKPPGGEDSLKALIKTNAKKDDCRLKNFQFPSNFLLKKIPIFCCDCPFEYANQIQESHINH